MAKLPDTARIQRVDLTVRDLDRELAFYRDTLGFRLHHMGERTAELGGDAPFLGLHEDPEAPPRPRVASGLYHMAILLPTREALGGMLRKLAPRRILEGASDHAVSEALYLSDPERNGIEIYADRPREAWREEGGAIAMSTQAMDVEGVLAMSPTELAEVPGATRMGHVHLQVGDVLAAEAWYRDVIGFDVTARYGPQASFLSAGGYHHHVAVNSWQSRGAPPSKGDELGLKSFSIVVPGLEKAAESRDPAGNLVRLVPV